MLMYIYDIYMLMYINISKHMIIYVYIYICVYDVWYHLACIDLIALSILAYN